MGAACCVAVRDKTIPDCGSHDIVHRNVRYSPSWSFRWDNRGRVAGEVETQLSPISDEIGMVRGLEIKSTTQEDSTYISEVGSPVESLQTPISQKSPISEYASGKLVVSASDRPFSRKISFEVQDKVAPSLAPSTSSLSVSPPSSNSQGQRAPHHSLDRRIPDYPFSEGTNSWSMQVFSELMVSSRRDRDTNTDLLSFDSEEDDDNATRSRSRRESSCSHPSETCGICSKILTEKSSWGGDQKLRVVAVLFCGHAYHAECLENMTPETSKYDPGCHICTFGGNQTPKPCGKPSKAQRRRHPRTIDNDEVEDESIKLNEVNGKGKGMRSGSSCSMKDSKRVVGRYFPFGSRGARSFSENHSGKKGFFWTRSSKE